MWAVIASSEAKVLIEIAQNELLVYRLLPNRPLPLPFSPVFSQVHPKITFSLSKRCRFGKRWYR